MPNIPLRRTLSHHQVTTNFDVTSVQDGLVRRQVLDQRDQSWDLRIIDLFVSGMHTLSEIMTYDDNVCPSFFNRSQRTAWRQPVTLRIIFNPIHERLLLLVTDTEIWRIRNTLQNIMNRLGDAENT